MIFFFNVDLFKSKFERVIFVLLHAYTKLCVFVCLLKYVFIKHRIDVIFNVGLTLSGPCI